MKYSFMEKYNMTDDDYRMLEIVVIENKPNKAGPQWKFAGAFYFATVVLAMIGYGHSTPVTRQGKAFCMGYAMVWNSSSFSLACYEFLSMYQRRRARHSKFIAFWYNFYMDIY